MMLSKLSKIVNPSFGRQLTARSMTAMPKPIENPDIKHTGVSRQLKIQFRKCHKKKICLQILKVSGTTVHKYLHNSWAVGTWGCSPRFWQIS